MCRGAARPTHDLEAARDVVAASVDADDPAARSPGSLVTCCAANLDHPQWDDVASAACRARTARSCARRASARAVEDVTTLDGDHAERVAAVGLVLHPRPLGAPRRGQRPRRHPLPLPAVAHPQAVDVVGPVRRVGLRRLRALHRLVPGRRSISPPRSPPLAARTPAMKIDVDRRPARRRSRCSADLDPGDLDLLGGCGRNEVFAAGAVLAREDEPADRFYVVRAGRVALELDVADRAPGHRDARPGRRGRLVVDLPAPSVDVRRRGPRGDAAWSPSTARACGEVRRRSGVRLPADAAVRPARRRSASTATRLRLLDLYGTPDAR